MTERDPLTAHRARLNARMDAVEEDLERIVRYRRKCDEELRSIIADQARVTARLIRLAQKLEK